MVQFTDEELVAEFSDLGVDIDKDDILDKCKREYTVFKHNFDHLILISLRNFYQFRLPRFAGVVGQSWASDSHSVFG